MDYIKQAFQVMARRHFLPEDVRSDADDDRPLPIGYGQTNSQPSTVYRMLKWLDPQPGDKILDVGSGSGWTTALLSYLVGNTGRVDAVEIIPKLVEIGKRNCEALGIKNVRFFKKESEVGLPEYALFDRILVSAGASELPSELIEQLKFGGKMVIPVRQAVLEIIKKPNNKLDIRPHEGFLFVPLK
jgi:protein-L-isoaspartate(D-aspartate) O-methyltransferase